MRSVSVVSAPTQEDLILLLADGAGGPYAFDPVRLMKGCFIISQAGRPGWRELFRFRAYAYGPFDSSVYSARDRLLAEGLLQAGRGGRYPAYTLTPKGGERATEVAEALGDHDAIWVRSIGGYVTSRSFSKLLDEVYERWPDYARNSVMRA
jgi:hypothetical protein